MPLNFPEIWAKRVINNIDKNTTATFLDGIPELDADVTMINEGDATEMNKIYVAVTEFDVDVLINNTTYPIAAQVYTDGTIEITLDKLQTKVVTVSDDAVKGSSYPKIDAVTKAHTNSISKAKYKKAIHSIAPADNANSNMPIILATGGVDALADPSGRLRLTYEDLVALKSAADTAGVAEDDRRLVLCENHWNDLLLDRKNFGNQLIDYVKGKPNPNIAGFELHKYGANPYYTVATKVRKPYGSVPVAGDRQASIMFVKTNIAKKTGSTKQYFAQAAGDPENQTNRLNYRHYFVATKFQNRDCAAII
ncbi:hypothetical protein AB670_02764 [Chryseobacterium sp. MOF25P]|uniref:hypothetical protein n=1 Tax=unclassified Chryseobacterium TaxID=2593645 RepID=UPI000804AA6D|nr:MULTISPECIES: hypothetical protein [unclassified Chryseobacterium]OBW40813.1 hypothetical protein AB670_02764 [Chryseobacterium sp. MOF25P]OBW45277.1 hypothetical protein AB671_02574 [Chryseobacterium sp. BGARF1]